MTSGDPVGLRAAAMLHRLSALLAEGLIAQLVDEPIDEVLEEFLSQEACPHSHESFHRTLAAFLGRLHEKALLLGCRISPAQAHDEAVALLEAAYPGTNLGGHDAAVAEAADPAGPGLPLVLARLAETLKARERGKYRAWVFARQLDPADWDTRCAIAGLLLEGCRDAMPSLLRPYPAEYWADEIPELLQTASRVPATPGQALALAGSSLDFQDIICAARQRS